MDLTELKAQAYDTLQQIESLQIRLQQLNRAIQQEARKPKEVKEVKEK